MALMISRIDHSRAGLGRWRHERGNDFPLGVRQVASVTQVIAAMLPPGGRGPHQALQTGFDNRLESHLNPAIHPYHAVSRRPLTREGRSIIAQDETIPQAEEG